jgi:hypothetical protein
MIAAGLSFAPQTVAEMKLRFGNALEPVLEPVRQMRNLLAGRQTAVTDRKHVFDFENGARMIVTREQFPMRRLVHFSFGSPQGDLFGLRNEDLEQFAIGIISELGHTAPVVKIWSSGNLHLWFKEQSNV